MKSPSPFTVPGLSLDYQVVVTPAAQPQSTITDEQTARAAHPGPTWAQILCGIKLDTVCSINFSFTSYCVCACVCVSAAHQLCN